MKAISIALIFVLLAAAQQPVQAPPAASAGPSGFRPTPNWWSRR